MISSVAGNLQPFKDSFMIVSYENQQPKCPALSFNGILIEQIYSQTHLAMMFNFLNDLA